MTENKIMNLCLRLGGTVYETVRMANPQTRSLLREFMDELDAVTDKAKLATGARQV